MGHRGSCQHHLSCAPLNGGDCYSLLSSPVPPHLHVHVPLLCVKDLYRPLEPAKIDIFTFLLHPRVTAEVQFTKSHTLVSSSCTQPPHELYLQSLGSRSRLRHPAARDVKCPTKLDIFWKLFPPRVFETRGIRTSREAKESSIMW